MNERTDLTSTEVSPRIMQEKAEKTIVIQSRAIKLSQEKKSIKQLNIKGFVQRNRAQHILHSKQSLGGESQTMWSVGKLSSFVHENRQSSTALNNQNSINILRQNNKQMLSINSSDNINQSPADIVNRNNLFGMNSPSNQNSNYDRRMDGVQTAPPKAPSQAITV